MAKTELGQAYVQIMPSAKGISGSIKKVLDPEAKSAGQSAGSSIGSTLVKTVTGIIASAGIGKALWASLTEGGKVQQSFGGLDTLYKGATKEIKASAREAYKAGISMNSYAEQAVSFGASLKQALGGDAVRAAKSADRAIMDMTDNSAKMGTEIESIQMAYQGFAKQNYTMLDNLKLGYGGTKTEMQRLLRDAEKLPAAMGRKFDLENFADVVDAIHLVQEELGLSGTASLEAKETFSGSMLAMKAAASNFLADLSLGEDIKPSLQALAETTSNFLLNNLLPMVGNVLSALPTVIGTVLEEGLERVFGASFVSKFKAYFAPLSEVAGPIVENLMATFENLKTILSNVGTFVWDLVQDFLGLVGLDGNIQPLADVFESLSEFVRDVSEKVKEFTDFITQNQTAMDALKSAVVGITSAWAGYKTVMAVIKGIELARKITLGITNGLMLAQFVQTGALTAAEAANAAATIGCSGAFAAFNAILAANPIMLVVTAIAALVAGLVWFFTQTETGQKIWAGFVDWIKSAWSGIADFFSGLWSGISSGASSLWDGVVAIWEAAVETVKGIWEAVVTFFTGLWDGIVQGAQTAWSLFTSVVMAIVQPFIDGFMNLWNNLKDGLSMIWEGITTYFQGVWELIKALFMGAVLVIIDLVTGNFTQLGADLGTIWEAIKSAVSLVWEGIKTIFTGIVTAIVDFVVGTFQGFASTLSALWDGIKSVASSAWEWLKSTVVSLVTGLVQSAQNTFNAFKAFLSGLWSAITSAATSGWNGLKSSVTSIITGLVSAAQRSWDNMKQAVRNLVDSVKSIFDGLRNIDLFGAGKAIIDGFLNGLKSAYGAVQDFVGGIADWIRANKGPIEYDRKLLIPAGNAIMEGLDDSLQESFKDVQGTVLGIAGSVVDLFEGDALDMRVTPHMAVADLEREMAFRGDFDRGQSGLSLAERMEVMQASLEALLRELVEKDTDVYLDGERLAQNSYERQARMLLREGI